MTTRIVAPVRLARAGLRPTRARQAILDVLERDRGRQLSAQEIHHKARHTMGLATVYRTLTMLAEAGVIDVVSHERGESAYRLCSTSHHHHLICSGCGTVLEIEECDLGALERTLSRRYKFRIEEHSITLRGRCAKCA